MAIAASDRAFVGVSALLLVGSVGATVAMSAARALPICGGGAITWPPLIAAASFLIMWVAMMAAMMLPSLLPVLWRYRQAVDGTGRDRLALLVGAGYFCVWTVAGVAAFPLAVVLPGMMRAVPSLAGAIVLIAGVLQFTPWKARHLACCRSVQARTADVESAWRQGLHLGLRCCLCSIGPTAVLLAAGMDPAVMAAAAVAMTAERLAPAGERVARAVGIVLMGTGLLLVA